MLVIGFGQMFDLESGQPTGDERLMVALPIGLASQIVARFAQLGIYVEASDEAEERPEGATYVRDPAF
jgi:hypothetical protein